MRKFIIAACFLLTPFPARAADCEAAWNHAVYPFWLIVNDIETYRAMFDNYDHLCTKYYPGIVKSLQPRADLLRLQVKHDAADATPAMSRLFDAALPRAVPPACRADHKARDAVRVRVLAAMQAREKIIAARLKRDAETLPDPQTDLALCQRLPALAPVVEKTLGPELNHPLLEMSVLNSHWMTGEEADRAPAVAAYRAALADVEHEK